MFWFAHQILCQRVLMFGFVQGKHGSIYLTIPTIYPFAVRLIQSLLLDVEFNRSRIHLGK